MRRAVAFAASLAVSTSFAQAGRQPPSEQMHASPGSPFMQQLLRRPFPATQEGIEEVVRLLHYSGNREQVDLLRRALGRAALGRIAGESGAPPATVGEAIEAERGSRRNIREAAREVMDRVVAGYPPAAVDAALQPAPDAPTHSKLIVTLRVTNGLEVPVSEAIFMAGPGDVTRPSEWTGLRCHPVPPIAARAARDVRCEGMRATEQLAPALEALRARGGLRVHTVVTPIVGILNGDPLVPYRDDRALDGAAMAQLAAMPCDEKGSCAGISREQRRQWKRDHSGTVFNVLALAALAAAAWASTRRRPADREAVPGAIASVALIGFSILVLATAMAAIANSYLAMVGFLGVYYGALPFVLVLLGVAATLSSGRRTPLRLFAVSFAVLSGTLLLATMVLG